jgi:glyoxylase-like metal-dependent hydrolase (beta-lactamase superfamily II)
MRFGMDPRGKVIRPNSEVGSGRVKQYILSKGRKLTQITTFCPDIIGPGPTHVYVVEDHALTMVDTGIPTGLAKQVFYYWRDQRIPPKVRDLPDRHSEFELQDGLKAAGYSLRDVELLVISHGHLDHFLLGRWVIERSGAKVLCHLFDTDKICNPWGLMKMWFEGRGKFMAMGMPLPEVRPERARSILEAKRSDLSLKVDTAIFEDGWLSLEGYKSEFISVRHVPGHSPGGIGLIVGAEGGEEKVLICGDLLLYPITPHPDDLVSYFRTLNSLAKLEGIGLVLPGHGENIRDMYQRISFLQKHHYRRFRLTYEACRRPKSAWQIATMPGYFDAFVDRDKFNPLAGREALLHIELLQQTKGLYLSHIDGSVHYFQNTGEDFDRVYERIVEIVGQGGFSSL